MIKRNCLSVIIVRVNLSITARQYGEGMAHFLPSRHKFCEVYACRGTSLIGAVKLSPVTKLVAGTGAVSRYNLSRNQKSVTMQDLNCGQMRVSGCKMLNEFIWPAECNMMIKRSKEKKRSGP